MRETYSSMRRSPSGVIEKNHVPLEVEIAYWFGCVYQKLTQQNL